MNSNPEPASDRPPPPKRARKIDLWSWRKTDLYFDFRDSRSAGARTRTAIRSRSTSLRRLTCHWRLVVADYTDIDKLRELAKRATSGPWLAHIPGPGTGHVFVGNQADGRASGLWEIVHSSGDRIENLTESALRQTLNDAEFIAAVNPVVVLALLDEIVGPRLQNEQLRDRVQELDGEAEQLAEIANVQR